MGGLEHTTVIFNTMEYWIILSHCTALWSLAAATTCSSSPPSRAGGRQWRRTWGAWNQTIFKKNIFHLIK